MLSDILHLRLPISCKEHKSHCKKKAAVTMRQQLFTLISKRKPQKSPSGKYIHCQKWIVGYV